MFDNRTTARFSRRMLALRTLIVSVVALVAFGLVHTASAVEDAWLVDGKLLGKKNKKAKNVSGIACANAAPPRKCLVIDDEVQFAQIVIVKEGEVVAGDTLDLISADSPWDIDGEAVAFSAGSGSRPSYFYVMGAHGRPRDRDDLLDPVSDAGEIKARFDASSVLVRVPLSAAGIGDDGKLLKKPKNVTVVDLRPMIYLQPELAPVQSFLGKRPDEDERGFNVEGLAALEGRLYVGLRAPTLGPGNDRSVVLSFDEDSPFDRKPPNAKLDMLPLGEKRGVRDMAPNGGDLLILAGPAYEPNTTAKAGKVGEFSIYAWDRRGAPRLLIDLPPFMENGKPVRPEGLLPLRTRADGGLDVLILSDGATEGGPRMISLPK
jgi:hypothetical protein